MLPNSELSKEVPVQAAESPFRTRLLKFLVALVAGHALWLASISSGKWGDAGSSVFQLFAAFFAAVACWQASRRSRHFAKIFWRLSAATFVVWSWGVVLNTYQNLRSSTPDENQIGTFLIIFLSTAPMFIASVLSGTSDDESKIHWDLVLDATQILVLVLAIHLLLVDIPSMTLGDRPTVLAALRLQNYWRLALAIALAARARFDPSPLTRSLIKPIAIAMAVFALGGWIGNDLEAFTTWRGARWFDLAWTIPFAMVAFSAGAWRQSPPSPAWDPKPARVESILLFYFPSIALPILLLSMRDDIQSGQIVVGLGAMMFSILCFCLRLLITQNRQRQATDALLASEFRYRSLFERNMAGIYTSTFEGRILDCNPAFCEMFGYTREELLGLPASVLYIGGDRERDALLADLQHHGSKRGIELPYLRKDGRQIWTIENVSVIADGNGKRILEGAMLDITQRRSLELQLQQSQKMESVGKLAGGVAHDFNNLLTVMRGYCDLQLEKTALSDPIHGYAQQIASAVDRASGLTRQLLAFSRQQVMQARVVNLNTLLRDFEKLLRRLVGEDIEMRTILDPELGNVKVDPGQMEQVVMNLVTNARDAMPEGGVLTLETSNVTLDGLFLERHPYVLLGPYVRLAVSDTGTGIDEDTRPHIFEPFFTTKGLGKGTGLGLATAYGIVKQSQGYIEVYSEIGVGSTFAVHLPRLDSDVRPLPAEKQLPAQRGKETILLVEDDEQLRSLAKTILESYGYTVLAVDDPSQAESDCEQHSGAIHLLLTDMIMPKINGREVARRVMARIPAIRVLYMSGFTTHTIVNQGVLEPGIFFLQKPFTAVALASKVREVLDHPASAQA
jgi:PAS domain S-box-containing protein